MLDKVVRGKLDEPFRIAIFGVEGVGKSTLAAGAPNPIFIPSDAGTGQLDIARFPEPKNWEEVLGMVKSLHGNHDYKTLVIDTLDGIEPLCWIHVCNKHPKGLNDRTPFNAKAGILGFPYGQGFAAALDEWRILLYELEQLRLKKHMNVIFVEHCQIKRFSNPEGEDFDRYIFKMHEKAAGIFKDWCDAVLFAKYETYTSETEDGRTKGIDSGKRILCTSRKAAFDAKNRYNMPETIPLDWEEGVLPYLKGRNLGDVLAELDRLAAQVPDDVKKKAANAVKRANGNIDKLEKLVAWMKGQVS
jgi:hypothetical protein